MPPFGFGMSMPNLRKVGSGAAPFVPVILVQDNWTTGSSLVLRTPSPVSGGGTWRVATSLAQMACGNEVTGPSVTLFAGEPTTGEVGVFRHSVLRTDATISAIIIIPPDAPTAVSFFARSTPGPNTDVSTGYILRVQIGSLEILKRVSGSEETLGFSSTSANNLLTSLTVSGSTLTATVAGVPVITVTDSSISNAGYFGCELQVGFGLDSWFPNSIGPLTIQTA